MLNGPTIGLVMAGNASWLGGVHYIENLVRAVRALPVEEQPGLILYYQPALDHGLYSTAQSMVDQARPARAAVLWTLAKDLREGGRRALLGVSLSKLARLDSVDVLFPVQESLGRRFPCRWIGWIPDFQHVILPDQFAAIHRRARDVRFRGLIRDADRIVLSSRTSLDHMRTFLGGEPPTRVEVLPFVAVPSAEWFAADQHQTRKGYGLPDRYFLVANQFWTHKNHMDVFEAVRLLKSQGLIIQVVCTGSTGDRRSGRYFGTLVDFLTTHRLASQVWILRHVPRQDHLALMRGALAIVQPSLFEGWSTVLEEARMLGKSVVASAIPVHLEQDPPDASYYPPGEVEGLATILRQLWLSDLPGHQPQRESEALRRHKPLIRDFAHRFLRVCTGVSVSDTAPGRAENT